MQATKLSVVTIGIALAGSLLLSSCDPGPNTQTGPLDLTVSTEDGTGDDANITTAVHTTLMADLQLKHLAIEVETRKGDVTLMGKVNTAEQRMLAEQITLATAGAHTVQNKIEVENN